MAGLQGTVELAAKLSPAGEVRQISVVSGPEPLTTPAKLTLSKWEFLPSGSQPAEFTVTFVFSFILDGSCNISHCPTDFIVDLPNRITVKSKVFDSPMVEGRGGR
jgi:hypothetical protein